VAAVVATRADRCLWSGTVGHLVAPPEVGKPALTQPAHRSSLGFLNTSNGQL
jgi:hypothetical protein